MVAAYHLPSSAVIDRHLHVEPYATLVLSGGYEEAGDAGRHRVGPGEVLIHDAFSAHRDVVGRPATLVLDLSLPISVPWAAGRGRVPDADLIVRIAERDRIEAVAALREALTPTDAAEGDLPDLLAQALNADVRIGQWATRHGRTREALSREFRRLYGIDAARFRAEARARIAWRMLVRTELPLAEVAAASGHADQAHMTRALRALTGSPPGEWRRRSHRFKTGSA